MRSKTNIGSILLLVLIFSISIHAQDMKKQAGQEFELPQINLEQKYKCAEGNLIAHYIAGISFARSKGVTPEDYGTFVGELYGQYWQAGENNPVKVFIRGMNYNMNLFQDFQMEILDLSDTVIKAKMNRKWEDRVKKFVKYGATFDEFHKYLEHLWIAIAKNLGLEYKQKFEDEWIIVTVTNK